MNFGAMPAVDFGEFIRLQFWEQTSAMINMAEQLLDTSQYAPDFWVDYLEEYSHNLREALLINESITPFDLKEHINGETPLVESQQLIYQFGELLSWWPVIVKSAKELRTKGHRIAAQIT